jgi:hypothetical protein
VRVAAIAVHTSCFFLFLWALFHLVAVAASQAPDGVLAVFGNMPELLALERLAYVWFLVGLFASVDGVTEFDPVFYRFGSLESVFEENADQWRWLVCPLACNSEYFGDRNVVSRRKFFLYGVCGYVEGYAGDDKTATGRSWFGGVDVEVLAGERVRCDFHHAVCSFGGSWVDDEAFSASQRRDSDDVVGEVRVLDVVRKLDLVGLVCWELKDDWAVRCGATGVF